MAVKKITDQAIATASAAEDHIALIDFSASWGGPCKMLEPILEKLSDDPELDRVKIYAVDVDNSALASSKFGVRGVPTMILFHKGEEIERLVGVKDPNALKNTLNSLADSKLQ